MEAEDMEEAELPELVADSDDEGEEEEEAGKRPSMRRSCIAQ